MPASSSSRDRWVGGCQRRGVSTKHDRTSGPCVEIRHKLSGGGQAVWEDAALKQRDELVAEIRARVDIVEVISDYVALKRSGKNYVGLCPFHQEDTPSFTVSPERQVFYCFGCQVGGDVFTFLMKQAGLDFPEALAQLARRAGVTLPDHQLPAEERRRLHRVQRVLQVLAEAARYFESLLRRDPAAERARAYLRARGLAPETVAAFHLGWSRAGWDDLIGVFRRQNVPADVLVAAGLAVRKEGGALYDRFRARLMFPIADSGGRIIGFGGRSLDDRQSPKYLNSPETFVFRKRQVLYGFDQARVHIRQTGKALIVEGYMDAITAHQAGFSFAVASLGTSLSEEQVKRFAASARQVYIAYDADAAGQQATLRGLEHFSRLAPDLDVRIVPLPAGEDPDSYIRRRGSQAFASLLERAQPLLEYVLERACAENDLDHAEGKVRVIETLAPWFGRLRSAILRDEYARRLADRLRVDEQALRAELRKFAAANSRKRRFDRQGGRGTAQNGHKSRTSRYTIDAVGGRVIQRAESGPLAGNVRAERELLRVLAHHPEQMPRVVGRVSLEDFTEPANRAIAEAMFRVAVIGAEWGDAEAAVRGHTKDWGQVLLDALGDEGARTLLNRWLLEGTPPGDVETIVSDCVQRIGRARVERRAKRLWQEIAERERSGQEVPQSWLIEYQQLQRELRASGTEGR